MDTLKQIVMQEANEERFSRKFIDMHIREDITDNEAMQAKITQGVTLLEEYIAGEYYASKMQRLAQLKGLDLRELVEDIYVGIAYFQREELLSSVSAQLASRLKFSDKIEGITTIAEILAVLCMTDAFDILKPHKMASLTVVSCIPLKDKTIEFIEHSSYLPPMVCTPRTLTFNYSSGYLTHNDSLILGKENHHDGDICLDVLNIMNKVPLKLSTEFLSTLEEDPTLEYTLEWAHKKAIEKGKPITDAVAKQRIKLAIDNWHTFKKQGYHFYSLLVNQGNRFYLTHKVDKRGRIYAQGYHINTQGTAFKKAMIELAEEELVTGVPT